MNISYSPSTPPNQKVFDPNPKKQMDQFFGVGHEDGLPLKILTLIDEYTRECLAIKVAR
jgi:hypothetical protein